ncbi:MAG TPA: uracil-DNA glycosylase family protein, partial [Gemmataceae bacterium]|nr:uracil-DNA glycosylase family protein [Gemmataceae bacterium]
PVNRPTPQERDNCLPYLADELRALANVRVILCLGAFAWDGAHRVTGLLSCHPARKERFGHGAETNAAGRYVLLGCYHPSQQNTFTGRLTAAMLDVVLGRARQLAKKVPGLGLTHHDAAGKYLPAFGAGQALPGEASRVMTAPGVCARRLSSLHGEGEILWARGP